GAGRAVAAVGLVGPGGGTGRGAAGRLPEARGAPGGRPGGRPAGRGGRGAGLRGEQPRADGLSALSATGPADQQRGGGEHDQADQPADQGDGEVLAGEGGRGGAAGGGGVLERG